MVPRPRRSVDPLVERWTAGKPIYRVHPAAHSGIKPYATARPARFRPVYDAADEIVPFLYGGEGERSAVAESVFHDVPVRRGPRRVEFSALLRLGLSVVTPTRELRLGRLHSAGLQRLRVRNRELIDTEPDSYPETAPWGQRLYEHPQRLDGLVWMSRRYNSEKALVLFGSTAADVRVQEAELTLDVAAGHPSIAFGAGYDLVAQLALDCDITIARD